MVGRIDRFRGGDTWGKPLFGQHIGHMVIWVKMFQNNLMVEIYSKSLKLELYTFPISVAPSPTKNINCS